jgi:probable HAF family extracellular repeat protein
MLAHDASFGLAPPNHKRDNRRKREGTSRSMEAGMSSKDRVMLGTSVRALVLLAAGWTVGGSTAGSQASRATFEGLGFLDPNGFGPVIAYGMSADGRVVVGQSNSPQGFQAFRWKASTGIVGLGAFQNPNGPESSGARACSADGTVIVGESLLPA